MQVQAMLPGAGPEAMASSVAAPLERQFSTIAGLTNMTSQSSRGYSQITVQFSLERSIDRAWVKAQVWSFYIFSETPPSPAGLEPRVVTAAAFSPVRKDGVAWAKAQVAG